MTIRTLELEGKEFVVGKHKPQRETILRIDQALAKTEKSFSRKRAG